MERSRITPRLRPRPYDLRRKVLLKNFFKEQMTYIPLIRSAVESSSDENNDSDLNENETNSNNSEGNVLTPKKVQDNVVSAVAIPEPAPSTSNCNEKENSNNLGNASSDEILSSSGEVEERQSTKFPRLSRIMETIDSQLSWRKNRRRGVTKAKYDLRSNKGNQKPVGWKTVKNSETSNKGKAKSFFEIFKSRRNRKRSKTVFSKKNFFGTRNSSPNQSKCDSNDATTSTQSVQTEISWSPDHYEKIEKSNRSLLEENRLLSESLSNIISNVDFRSGNLQNSCCTDAYTDNVDNPVTHFDSDQKLINKADRVGSNSEPAEFSRTRILRSKSMYDRSEKRSNVSSRLRTRSMNYKYIKRPTNSDSFIRNEPHFSDNKQYRVNSIASPPRRAKTKPAIPENVDVFPLYNTNTRSYLQRLPNKSSKPLMRRSSMPERTYYWNDKARPVRSSSMRENNHYSTTSRRVSRHNQFSHYHPVQSSYHRRSSTYNGYSYSVPFQDLPSEAFY